MAGDVDLGRMLCLGNSYFPVILIRFHHEGTICEKDFILAYWSRGMSSLWLGGMAAMEKNGTGTGNGELTSSNYKYGAEGERKPTVA